MTAAACLALVLVGAPSVLWPQQFGQLAQRFLAPWQMPPVVVPYALSVQPGDAFVKQGAPLLISVRAVPDRDNVKLPTAATLVLTDLKTDQTQRLPMLFDSPGSFSRRIDALAGSFRYAVEAGDASSGSHQITSVVPVELAAKSPTVTPLPPTYAAKAGFESEVAHGLTDLSALQHSRLRFDLRFTRPAVKATLSFGPPADDKKAWKPTKSVALPLTPDRLGATVEEPLRGNLRYRIVLEAEHNIRSDYDAHTVFSQKDLPPVIKFEGKEDLRAVNDTDRVPLPFSVTDDIGVARAAIEYQVNDGKSNFDPVTLEGVNTRMARTTHLLRLAGKVKPNDLVRYRLVAWDNRDVPDLKPPLHPQKTVYPADHWLTLKVVSNAKPLGEQEILAQRDDIQRRLEKIKKDLGTEKRQVYKVQQESQTTPGCRKITRSRLIRSPRTTRRASVP